MTPEDKILEEHFRSAKNRMLIETALRLEGRLLNMIDPDEAVALADRKSIVADIESEVVIGAAEAVAELATRKPYLFSKIHRQHKNLPMPDHR